MSQGVGTLVNLSKDLETEGFDLQAGQTWIYPTNYPIRDYQYNILQQALLKNTLVSLPTGLGKTFIAAVVMYNFFRWYPLGKVIFMAPTRPLVKQQIEACYDIMAIPKNVTAELTGTKLSSSREDIWKEKRVFFITPQILQNDLEKLIGLPEKIKCLVFDEAHRARGNHAYCEVIRKLIPHNKYFRVLALSATPGNTTSDVLEVVKNLLISHLEFRTEESLDVHPYVFERNLTTIVVPLGQKLQQVRDDYMEVLEYYTRTLVKYKVIQGNCGNLTKGKIFMTLKEFQQKSRNSSSNYAEIMKSLNICITLYHGFELLIRHGLRSFLSFFDEHADKPLLRGNTRLLEIMTDIREYLGPEPVIDQLPDGSFTEIPNTTKFGHPKFYKLRDILVSHFVTEDDSSKVIVFFEYRNSVMEAYALLNQARPLLKPKIFVGQGHGITQRQQLNVIKSYKEGQCNILLSTCIGEEGLDIGEVDLIICFDISSKSPIRMVQRMGRTGRKKAGKIVVLVTEGKEQQILKDCLIQKSNIAVHVLSSQELAKGLITNSPRLIPTEIVPKCDKIFITIQKPLLSKKSSLKDMFRNVSSSSGSEPHFSSSLQIEKIPERIPIPHYLWDKENTLDKNLLVPNIFSKRLDKQRILQSTLLVKHSPTTKLLVHLLQHVDSKRFNIPETQIGGSTQLTQCKNFKQTDIRHMFAKSQSCNDFLSGNSAQNVFTQRADFKTQDHSSLQSKNLLAEISDFLSIEMSNHNIIKCKHCPLDFDCAKFYVPPHTKDITLAQHDDSMFKSITLEDINLFFELHISEFKSNLKTSIENDHPKNIQFKDEDKSNVHSYLPSCEKTCTYEAPKTLDFLLNKYSTSIINLEDYHSQEQYKANEKLFFDNSSEKVEIHEYTDVLHYFKLDSFKDLFHCNNLSHQETEMYSPDIIDNSVINRTNNDNLNDHGREYNLSPVLCTFDRAKNIKNCQKDSLQYICSDVYNSITNNEKAAQRNKPNLKRLIETPSKFAANTVKSCSTPISSKIPNEERRSLDSLTSQLGNINDGDHPIDNLKKHGQKKLNDNTIDIDDICDLSIFGLTSENVLVSNETKKKNNNNELTTSSTKTDLDIEDICDLTLFGIENKGSRSTMDKPSQEKKCMKLTPPHKNTQTQISITQIIDLVNNDKKPTTSSQKQRKNCNIQSSACEDLNSRKKCDKLLKNTEKEINIVKPSKSTRYINPFIENEAELSIDDNIDVSEDEDDEDHNLYDTSFVDDRTHNMDTQMHIRYLQSIRSPRNRGRFKIPERPAHVRSNIYSQEIHKVDETYLDDSFVVHDESEEDVDHELSELEILEKKLQDRKNKRKCDDIAKPVKRRRIKEFPSDDSD